MGHIEQNKHLAASPEALWAVVSNPNTWGDWFTIHERWMEEPSSEIAVGQKLVAKVVMLGMANKFEWSVDAVDLGEPKKLSLSAVGMAGVKVDFTFTVSAAADGGTEFNVAGDFEGALIKGALGKAVEKDGLNQLEKSLDQLDALATANA